MIKSPSGRKKPFFSIIIPLYNGAATLGCALDSLLRQSCHDFELIIVDNLSVDNSLAIVDAKAPALRRCGINIQINSEADNGVYYAMNRGIELAFGRYLAILGSDDLFTDDALEIVKNEHADCDIILGRAYKLFQDKKRLGNIYPLEQGMPTPHQAIFIKKELHGRIGGYSSNYSIVADYEFLLRAKQADAAFKLLNRPLAYFQTGGEGISSNNRRRFLRETHKLRSEYRLYRYIDIKYIKALCRHIFIACVTFFLPERLLKRLKKWYNIKFLAVKNRLFRRKGVEWSNWKSEQ